MHRQWAGAAARSHPDPWGESGSRKNFLVCCVNLWGINSQNEQDKFPSPQKQCKEWKKNLVWFGGKGIFFLPFRFSSVALFHFSFTLLRFISLKKLKACLCFDYDKGIEYLYSHTMGKNLLAGVNLCDSEQELLF